LWFHWTDIGFDAVSTCAQETKKPERDLPIGTLCSLAICTVLYIAVCLIAVGLTPYYNYRGIAHPISFAVEQYPEYKWLAMLINVGAIAGLTSVILVNLMVRNIVYTSYLPSTYAPL